MYTVQREVSERGIEVASLKFGDRTVLAIPVNTMMSLADGQHVLDEDGWYAYLEPVRADSADVNERCLSFRAEGGIVSVYHRSGGFEKVVGYMDRVNTALLPANTEECLDRPTTSTLRFNFFKVSELIPTRYRAIPLLAEGLMLYEVTTVGRSVQEEQKNAFLASALTVVPEYIYELSEASVDADYTYYDERGFELQSIPHNQSAVGMIYRFGLIANDANSEYVSFALSIYDAENKMYSVWATEFDTTFSGLIQLFEFPSVGKYTTSHYFSFIPDTDTMTELAERLIDDRLDSSGLDEEDDDDSEENEDSSVEDDDSDEEDEAPF